MIRPTLALAAASLLLGVGCRPDPRSITRVTAELEPIVQGSNEYAWESWQASRDHAQGNLFSSPFSQVAAMSMVLAGARGETEAELAAALSVPEGGEEAWHEQLGLLIADLSGEHHRPYTLYTANQLWGQADYPWEQPFLELTADAYQAPLEDADFRADPEAARADINDWVAHQTRDRIPELFGSGDINSLTRMVLANAIYFLADWDLPFDQGDTQDRAFTLADGGEVMAATMSQNEEHGFAALEGLKILEMSYESGEVSMVFLLPDQIDGLEALEDGLDRETVDGWLEQLRDTQVDVRIPSFQMDTEFPLEEVLVDLGVESAWIEGQADFSGMLDPEVEKLWLSRVVHKAFVRLDEEGTEAAAATGAVMSGELAYEPSEPATFHADHPFVFLIRDRLTGTILFQGRMSDPSLAPLQE
jgi:serpin B